MIKFFRQSYAIQYVVLALLAIALWAPVFVAGHVNPPPPSPVTPLYNWVSALLDASPLLMLALAFVLMLFEALFFNSMLVANQIVGKVSAMGAFVFLLFMNLTLTQTNFYPFSLSMLFLLLLVHTSYSIYRSQNIEYSLLNAGVFLALASMCYFPSAIMLVWIAMALVVSHNSSLRLQFIPMIGFLFTYFAYFVFCFFVGDIPEVWQGYVNYFKEFSLSVEGFGVKQVVLLVVMVLSVVLPLFNARNLSFEKTVSVWSKITMSIILLVFGVLMLFFGGDVLMHGVVFLALSILAAYELSYIEKTAMANLMLYALLLFVILNRYILKIM